MIVVKHKGNFNKTERFLQRARKTDILSILDRYGQMGVEALRNATPFDTGMTAASWGYEIEYARRGYSITWTNSNVQDGVPIAILLQYGHGTRNGGYVQGRDYINPALAPIFDAIAEEAWKEVAKQ